jgi:hypothetical protein
MKLKTPLLPGKYSENFTFNISGKEIEKFKIDFSVNDNGQKVLKIRPTEFGYVVVRSESSTSAKEIGRAPQSSEYLFTEIKNNFYKIDFNGKEAWVSARYSEILKK